MVKELHIYLFIYVGFLIMLIVLVDLVHSFNRTSCCSRLAFIQPQLDFLSSEEKPLIALFIGSMMFHVHALNSEHVKYACGSM